MPPVLASTSWKPKRHTFCFGTRVSNAAIFLEVCARLVKTQTKESCALWLSQRLDPLAWSRFGESAVDSYQLRLIQDHRITAYRGNRIKSIGHVSNSKKAFYPKRAEMPSRDQGCFRSFRALDLMVTKDVIHEKDNKFFRSQIIQSRRNSIRLR